MSFILDALKKAESERNRRIAPVLMDARIAPPRRGLPGWALALGVVLLVNLGVVTWLLLRTPAVAPGGDAAAPSADAAPSTLPPQAGAAAAPAAPAVPITGVPQGTVPATGALTAEPPPPIMPPAATDPDNAPSLQELQSAGVSLPDLQLNLHVYDPAPAQRWVLLNGQRMREGDYTANGVKVERITPVGVVLEAGGRHFRLDAGG